MSEPRGKALQIQTQKRFAMQNRRQLVAVNLLAGLSYTDIAEITDSSNATITRDVKYLLKEWRTHYTKDVDDWVKIKLRQLDMLYNAIHEKAMKGNIPAIREAHAIIQTQCKLLGITEDSLNIVIQTDIQLVWGTETNAEDNDAVITLESG